MTIVPQIMWRYARFDDLRLTLADDVLQNLSAAERAELSRWRNRERREEWILARALARQLVAAHFMVEAADECSLEICSRDSLGRGVRPLVTIGGRPAAGTLSIAHTRSAALVAVSTATGVTVGADLVHKTLLGKGFRQAWFDEHERRSAAGDDGLEACRLWAAKEAVYKAANQNDPFAPRQICLRGGDDGEYRCSYRGAELGDRCQVTTWECDDHVAALAVVNGGPAHDKLPVGRDRVATGTHPISLELLTSLRT